MKRLSYLNLVLVLLLSNIALVAQTKSANVLLKKGENFNSARGLPHKLVGEVDGKKVILGFRPPIEMSTGVVMNLLSPKSGSTLRAGMKKIYLGIFDENLNNIGYEKINLNYQGHPMEMVAAHSINGKVYVFSAYRNPSEKKNYLFASTVNAQSVSINEDMKKIAEIDFDDQNRLNPGYFQVELSQDSSKVLVVRHLPEKSKKSRAEVGYTALDNNLNELWTKNVRLPFKDQLTEIKSFVIDNDGHPHYLVKAFKNKDREISKGGKSNYTYRLYSFIHDQDTMVKNTISFGKNLITNAKLAVNPYGELIVAGFTAEAKAISSAGGKRKKSGLTRMPLGMGSIYTTGSFYQRIDALTGRVLAKNHHPFDIDFMVRNDDDLKAKAKVAKKMAEDKVVGIRDLEVEKILLSPDGGALILAEQNQVYIDTKTISEDDFGGIKGRTLYERERKILKSDIGAFYYGPTAELKWKHRISKLHKPDYHYVWSFEAFQKDGDTYIFFNDNVKNLNYHLDKKVLRSYPSKHRYNVISMVKISRSGDKSYRKILGGNNLQNRSLLSNSCAFRKDENRLYFVATRLGKKRANLVSVDL